MRMLNGYDLPERLFAKLIILTHGLDIDFDSLRNIDEDIVSRSKVNYIRVSDKHDLDPADYYRKLIPDEILIKDDKGTSVVNVYYKSSSPLELTHTDKDGLKLRLKNNEFLEDIDVGFVPLKEYYFQKCDGVPLHKYLSFVGLDRMSIVPYDGCSEFLHGSQCRFCGANPKRLKQNDGSRPQVFEIKSRFGGKLEEWWQSYKERFRDGLIAALQKLENEDITPHQHLLLTAGNLPNRDFAWELSIELVESAFEHSKFSLEEIDSYINLAPPDDFGYIDLSKEIGFRRAQFNMEVYSPKLFKQVVPGKANYGYEKLMNALEYAVDVFGDGMVRSNFVMGAEPVENLIKGARELAEKGIVADYSVFFPRPASVWRNRSPPEARDVLRAAIEINSIYRDHGFDPIYCEVSSRSSIANEIRLFEDDIYV